MALCVHGPAAPAHGEGLITGSYDLSWDQDVDKTEEGTTNIRKFKHALNLKYKGLLAPLLENSVEFKVEQEINSNGPDQTRFLPTLDLGLKGYLWEADAGGKRTHENSDEPGKNPKITDSYFVELFYLAPDNIPDLKVKYTLDTDFEEGTTDTGRQNITLSSVYKPTGWLDLKGEYTREVSEDRINPDTDTEDEDIKGGIGIRRFLSEKIKLDVQYELEINRGATLLDAGGATNEEEEQKHTVKNALSFRPTRETDVDLTYDYEIDQDMVTDIHTFTTNAKATVVQRIGKPFELTGEFTRDVTEERHVPDNGDNEKTEDKYIGELKAVFAKQLDFSLKVEKTETEEVFAESASNTSSSSLIKTFNWTGELTPFWKASASLEKTDSFGEFGEKTSVETKETVKSTFDFKSINLTLDPSYDVTLSEDLVIPEETETRDFKFKIAYTMKVTENLEAKLDHTYGRKTDSGASNIQRTDDTTGNVTWTDPLPGWTASVDMTRQATDTSEDDLQPDITSSFGFKADYKGEQMAISTSYKYDKKSLTDDSETFDFKVGWTAPDWEATLTYSFDKTFSAEVNEGYSLSLVFKYNL